MWCVCGCVCVCVWCVCGVCVVCVCVCVMWCCCVCGVCVSVCVCVCDLVTSTVGGLGRGWAVAPENQKRRNEICSGPFKTLARNSQDKRSDITGIYIYISVSVQHKNISSRLSLESDVGRLSTS